MITKLTLNCVASYKDNTILQTDKKVNLIYGLNGTGKSTLSNYLYDKADTTFYGCSIEGGSNEEILVYNQRFIRDYFYESDNLKGIFTLSKENKEAEQRIRNAENELKKLEGEKLKKTTEIVTLNDELSKKKINAENTVWDIKTTYTGGDRVLEFCLEGLKKQKEKLFTHIADITKPTQKPDKTTDMLKKEVESLQGENAQKHTTISPISFTEHDIENNPLFKKEIIGNENSTVAELIKKLDNPDWVKKGLSYLPEIIGVNGETCPFCQEKTITKTVLTNIKDYFNESYENDLNKIFELNSDYEKAVNSIQPKEVFETKPFIIELKTEFTNKYDAVFKILRDNIIKIEEKQKTPSQMISLKNSTDDIEIFNQFISDINKKIDEHNLKIDNIDDSLKQINSMFWNIMRWEYDQTLSIYQNDSNNVQIKISNVEKEITLIEANIKSQKDVINKHLKSTINIEEAIVNINCGLIELGIDSFQIVKYSDILYKIVRGEHDENTFLTLSEGEKMIISFLYFRELCKGKKNATDISNKKIIVIDDPISSLSHIYIFNIGQLIKNDFFNSDNYEQVFVLTHSLYFFYELVHRNDKKREQTQKLHRMIKNINGSQILEMNYDEIQNDYHSYWLIVNDETQPPALIANCMRNIVEYFFGFVENRKSLNNIFQKKELKANRFQAFCRYIDRESHSVGQNIFDYKEFNYNDFREALKLVFKESGYEEHYRKMTS